MPAATDGEAAGVRTRRPTNVDASASNSNIAGSAGTVGTDRPARGRRPPSRPRAGQLMAVVGAELAQQRRHVRLDGPFGDVQAGSDLRVRPVLADQRQHLASRAASFRRSPARRYEPRPERAGDRNEVRRGECERRLGAARARGARSAPTRPARNPRGSTVRTIAAVAALTMISPPPSRAAQPGNPIHRRTEVVAVAFDASPVCTPTRVRDRRAGRPRLDPIACCSPVRSTKRVAGPAEHRERRVALTLRLDQRAALRRRPRPRRSRRDGRAQSPSPPARAPTTPSNPPHR